jgi:hypothetical protein
MNPCRRERLACYAGAALFLLVPALRAGPILQVDLDPNDFGSLDQKDTKCKTMGCGATAAVNSFVFLQKKYADLYDTKLVPDGNAVKVADTLLDLMNISETSPVTPEGFILGKQKYIETQVPGKTTYAAQMSEGWTPARGKQPDYVKDATNPNIDFLFAQLRDKEDIEVLIKFRDGGGHALTVTGLTWNPDTLSGELRYVDPEGGKPGSSNIRQPGAGRLISVEYPGHPGINTMVVAVSESPIPEPSSLTLCGIVAFGVIAYRRRLTFPGGR